MKKLNYLKTKIQKKTAIVLGLITVLIAGVGIVPAVLATTFMTKATILETNMNTTGNSAVYVSFTAGAADSSSTLTVNFSGWTGGAAGSVNSSQTVTTSGCTGVTGASQGLPSTSSLTAAGSSSTVTVSNVNSLTNGTSYCFELNSTSAVTNPTASGQSTVVITDGTDTATVSIDNIANDQVVVSGTVPPSFTLALSGNTDSFASNLSSTSTVSTNGVTATINTNATSGWGLWAVDSSAGLNSASEVHTINTVSTGSNHSFTTGTEQYGLGVTTGNATANYADGGGSTGSGLSTSTYNEIASSNAPASGVTANIKELADISATTPAAQDYTDTVTIVGAGSF